MITLPKTIDNDIFGTDITFGFDTALQTATEAIDRLHSTATSHHRIIVVETMGHRAGWLALGAGIAGGADVILIPEQPYSIEVVAEAIRATCSSRPSFQHCGGGRRCHDPAAGRNHCQNGRPKKGMRNRNRNARRLQRNWTSFTKIMSVTPSS